MPTAAVAAKGTQLQRGDGGGTEVFTTIAEVLNVSGPSESVGTLDATSMDSTAKEFISSGLADGGEVSFECHFISNNAPQQGLRSDMRAGTKRNFKILLPDTTVIAFTALVTNMGNEAPAEGKLTQSVTLKLSGVATFTYAA